MNLESLLSRTHKPNYGCNEFACEAWKMVTGEDLAKRMQKHLKKGNSFEEITEPISPCIVFFSRNERSSTHVGLFFNNRIWHLGFRGAQNAPLEHVRIGFSNVRFYQ